MGAGKTAGLVLFLALFVYYLPYFVMYFNSFTPFKVVHTDAWKSYMDFRRSFRAERKAVPLPEIDLKDLTKEKFFKLTNDLSTPLIVRGMVPAVEEYGKIDFWLKNYANSTVNCVDMKTDLYRACTFQEFIDYNLKEKRNVYSRTNHEILFENPELLEKLKNPISKWISDEPLYEIFFGFGSGGSPLHAAFGINFFKQITGHKKWTLWSPSELPWMDLHLSDDAASLLAIGGRVTYTDAEWIKRTNRYEGVFGPGDGLFNPCMWMHIVENIEPKRGADEMPSLIIGSPERHFGVKFGWKTSSYVTTHLVMKKIMIKIYQKMMGLQAEKSAVDFLPMNNLERARGFDDYIRMRAKELANGKVLDDI